MSAADRYVSPIALPQAASGRSPAVTNRAIIIASFALATAAGFLATDTHQGAAAAALAGPDLVRLLRAMAAIKSLMALAAVGATLWRLGAPVGSGKLLAYTIACAAMAAGPGLIWGMAHVGTGALLLHGGLAAAVLLLWRDPATSMLLSEALQKRRR